MNSTYSISILHSILIILFLTFHISSNHQLNDEERYDQFTQLLQKNYLTLVVYGTEWCPQTQSILNDLSIFIRTDRKKFISNGNYAFIDCTLYTKICSFENILFYPTIRLYLNEKKRGKEKSLEVTSVIDYEFNHKKWIYENHLDDEEGEFLEVYSKSNLKRILLFNQTLPNDGRLSFDDFHAFLTFHSYHSTLPQLSNQLSLFPTYHYWNEDNLLNNMEQFTNHIQLGYHLIIFYSPTCIHCRRILLIANEFTKVMEHVMKKLFDENLLLIFLNSRKYGMIDGAMAIMIMNQIVKEVPVLTKRMMEKDSHNFYPSILKWKLYDRSIIEHLLNENRQVSLSQFDYNVKLMKEKGKKWINDIQLINLIGSHTYSLRFVNCKEAHDVCNHNKIPSYPTIRFYANGMHIQQYEDQSRTMNDLLRWFLIQVQEQIIMSMKKSSYNVDQSPYDDIDEKDWEVNENDERESSIDGNNWFSENRMKNNLAQFISSELVDDMDQSPTIFHGSEILNFETVLPALSSDDGNEEGDLTVDDRIVNLTEMLELFSFPDLMTTKAKRIFNFFSKVQFAERVKEGIVSRYKLITIDQNGLSKNEFYSIISFMMGTWYSMQNNDVNVKKHIVLLIHTHNQQLGNHGDEWKSLKSLIDQYMTRWSSILSDYNSFDRNGIINLEIDCGHSEKLCKHLMGDEDKEQIIVMSLHENMFYVQSYEGVFSLFDVWRFIDIHFEYLWKDWASSNLETFKYLLHVNLLLKSKEMSLNFYETEESLIEVLKELIEWYWLNVKENPHKRINLIYEDFFTFVTNRLDWTNVETTKRKLTANLQNLILSEIPLAFTYYFLKDDN